MGDRDYNILVNNLKAIHMLICVWWGIESLKRNGSVPTNKMSEDVDQNHTMTYRKMDTVKSVTDMCEGGAYIKRVIVV